MSEAQIEWERVKFEGWAEDVLFEALTAEQIKGCRHLTEEDAYNCGSEDFAALMLTFAWLGYKARAGL